MGTAGAAPGPGPREQVLSRYATLRFYHLFLLIGTFFVVLYLCGWGIFVERLCTLGEPGKEWILPGVELLPLVPFITGLVLSWVCFYDAERALHADETSAFWSRWDYVGFHVRHNLGLVCVPVGLLILERGAQRVFPGLGTDWQLGVTVFGMISALSVFLAMPWILRLVLGLKPLPPGPLRDRLVATSRRLRFRCSDILLWNTHGTVANAMVAGVLPCLRYVVLTDRLLDDLTPDEVEAVFGHEVGHVKHHHMLYYLAS